MLFIDWDGAAAPEQRRERKKREHYMREGITGGSKRDPGKPQYHEKGVEARDYVHSFFDPFEH